jgi:hypothetical protein
MTTETASHILYECVALAKLKFHHLGKHYLEPSDYEAIPLRKLLFKAFQLIFREGHHIMRKYMACQWPIYTFAALT